MRIQRHINNSGKSIPCALQGEGTRFRLQLYSITGLKKELLQSLIYTLQMAQSYRHMNLIPTKLARCIKCDGVEIPFDPYSDEILDVLLIERGKRRHLVC